MSTGSEVDKMLALFSSEEQGLLDEAMALCDATDELELMLSDCVDGQVYLALPTIEDVRSMGEDGLAIKLYIDDRFIFSARGQLPFLVLRCIRRWAKTMLVAGTGYAYGDC